MLASFILGIKAIIVFTIGVWLNEKYKKDHGVDGVQWVPFAFQVIFTCGEEWSHFFGGYKSDWHIFWNISTLFTYAVGWWMCWNYAKKHRSNMDGVGLAIMAQTLLPMGLAVLILFAILIVGSLFVSSIFIISSKGFWLILILLAIFFKSR